MLTLTRKNGEAIILRLENGDQIDIIVAGISNNQVRISIDADDSVEIKREELLND